MSFLIDIFVILFVLIVVYSNYKKGLIGVAFKIFSFFIAIVISLVLFKPVSYFITNTTTIDEKVNSYVYNIVDEHLTNNKENNKNNSTLPNSFSNYIDKSINETSKTIKNNVTVAVAGNISSSIINILSFIIIYILSRFILIFAHFISDKIAELPILKQFNELGGFIYGILKAFFIVFIILAIFSILPFSSVQDAINSTYFTLFLYSINPILWLLF